MNDPFRVGLLASRLVAKGNLGDERVC